MEINVLNLIPKEWRVEKIDNDLIRVTNPSRARGWTNRKSIILKKLIPVTEDFIAGIAMYLGDGKLARDPHLAYASKDIDILSFMVEFFEEYLNISRENISFVINYRTDSEVDLWAEYLQIPSNKIRTYQRDRNKFPAMTFQIGSVILRELFGRIINSTLKLEIVSNKKLRRAFLKGLFAAEGSIGVQRTEKPRPYINAICYHFHEKEVDLINYCCRCLKAEEITYNFAKSPRMKSTSIVITNWNNYWKLWKMNLFDLCERKKRTFLEISKQACVKYLLNEEFRHNIINSTKLYQRTLAKELGTYQASVCRMKQGRFLLTLKQLNILSNLSGIGMEEIKTNVETSRISNTYLREKEFLEFMYNLQLI